MDLEDLNIGALTARITFFPENFGWIHDGVWVKRDQLIWEIKNQTKFGKAYAADPYKRLEGYEIDEIPQSI